MARDMSNAMAAELTSTSFRPVFLVSVALKSEVLRLFTGTGTLQWGGYAWTGAADLGKIGDISETVSQNAQGFTLSFSGVQNGDLREALDDLQVGRPAEVYLGGFSATGQVVADPVLLKRGRIDKWPVKVGTSEATITLNVENVLNDQQRALITRYTSEDQKRKFPADTGCDFQQFLADAAFSWGS